MKSPRLSIAKLMVVIIPVALGLAALRSATQLWVNIVFNLTVATLLFATYEARCSRGIGGVWWVGFASFGWVHLTLGLTSMPYGQHFGVQPDLVTWILTWQFVEFLVPSDQSAAMAKNGMATALILQSILSLLFSLLGATLFSIVARRRMASDGSASPGR